MERMRCPLCWAQSIVYGLRFHGGALPNAPEESGKLLAWMLVDL